MNVLIQQNVTAQGPGTIEDHLRTANIPVIVVDLERGHSLPDASIFMHLVILGGPMAVSEMDQTAYLQDEAHFIEKAVKENKHVLGVCLGAQMLAHVLGARVYAGRQKEIGWETVLLTADGRENRCMRELAVEGDRHVQVFQWHGDTFDLPAGAVRLASSVLYPN